MTTQIDGRRTGSPREEERSVTPPSCSVSSTTTTSTSTSTSAVTAPFTMKTARFSVAGLAPSRLLTLVCARMSSRTLLSTPVLAEEAKEPSQKRRNEIKVRLTERERERHTRTRRMKLGDPTEFQFTHVCVCVCVCFTNPPDTTSHINTHSLTRIFLFPSLSFGRNSRATPLPTSTASRCLTHTLRKPRYPTPSHGVMSKASPI